MPNVPVNRLLEASPFDRFYGLQVRRATADEVDAVVEVRPELLQPTGVVHGGVFAAMAEGIASLGTNVAVHERGCVAFGMTNATSFLRPIGGGRIDARATARHVGRSTAVWDVELSDEAGRLCAVGRVTLAIRPAAA